MCHYRFILINIMDKLRDSMEEQSSRHLRVLQVLEQLANASYPQTLAQLTQRTGLPKTTLMRMLNTLEQMAYVSKLPGAAGYTPGPRANHLALSVIRTPHFLRACRAVLGKLVVITGESCNLTALSGDAVQYLARVETTEILRLQLHLEIGVHVPLHCTASGKLFLACLPLRQQKQILDRIELAALTPRTITQREALVAELERIRSQSMGIDNEEFVQGMVAVSVPVLDAQDNVIAAVACHAPTARISLSRLAEFAPAMRRAATEMSAVFLETGQP
jgi:DNA-binding IclR family transcriptional regulator